VADHLDDNGGQQDSGQDRQPPPTGGVQRAHAEEDAAEHGELGEEPRP